MERLIIILSTLLVVACSKKSYNILDPKPNLNVTLIQDSYPIDEPIFVQINASQRGYKGTFKLSIVLFEGECDILLNGGPLSAAGEWIELSSNSEILTITPRATGILKLSFEIKTLETMLSGRSTINLNIETSSKLTLSAECPQMESIKNPVEIIMTASKKGFSGVIPIRFEQIDGSGTLQFGTITVPAANTFSLPANSEQTLYYIPSARGIHKLQFAATDGYTTEFKTIETLITE